MTSPVRAVIFDLGGVLVPETDQIAAHAAALGMPEEQMRVAYWNDRHAYDSGLSTDAQYWTGVAGRPVDDEEAQRLAGDDSTRWMRIRPAARAILAELKEAGVPRFILSNAPAALQPTLDAAEWRHLVDGRFVSGHLVMAKPDEAIYRHVEDELGLHAAELAFVDDKPENLVAPERLGWQTHLWTSDGATRAWLVDLGLLQA